MNESKTRIMFSSKDKQFTIQQRLIETTDIGHEIKIRKLNQTTEFQGLHKNWWIRTSP